MLFFIQETFINDEGNTIIETWGPGHSTAAEAVEWFTRGEPLPEECNAVLLAKKPEDIVVLAGSGSPLSG